MMAVVLLGDDDEVHRCAWPVEHPGADRSLEVRDPVEHPVADRSLDVRDAVAKVEAELSSGNLDAVSCDASPSNLHSLELCGCRLEAADAEEDPTSFILEFVEKNTVIYPRVVLRSSGEQWQKRKGAIEKELDALCNLTPTVEHFNPRALKRSSRSSVRQDETTSQSRPYLRR